MGNEIPIPRAARWYQSEVQRFNHPNLRRRRCEDTERGSQQRPCAYAHRVSAIKISLRSGEKIQRPNLTLAPAGISRVETALLGQTLLGDRVWGLEHGWYYWSNGAGISWASSWSKQSRKQSHHPWVKGTFSPSGNLCTFSAEWFSLQLASALWSTVIFLCLQSIVNAGLVLWASW